MAAINGLAFTRRELLQLMGFQAAVVALGGSVSVVEAMGIEPQEGGQLRPFNRFPRMVHEYFVGRVRAAERISAKTRASMKTRADAVAYVRHTQNKIRACFGSFPQKTPLNARITGVVERDSYRIEKVIFESRPGFPKIT